jgi:hypothetical protein
MMVNNTFDYHKALKVINESSQKESKEKELMTSKSKESIYEYTSSLKSPSQTATKWNSNYLTSDVTSPTNKSINIKIINNNNNHYIITPQDNVNSYQPPQETKSFYNTFRKSYLAENEVKLNNFTNTSKKPNNSSMSSYLNDMEPRYSFHSKPLDKPSYLTSKYNAKTTSQNIPDKKPTETKMLTRTSIQSNFRNYSSPKSISNERPSTSVTGKDRNYRDSSYIKDMQRVPSTHSLSKPNNDRTYFGYKDNITMSPLARPMTASSSVQKFNSTTVYRSNYERDDFDKRGFSQSSRSNSKINSVQRDLRNTFSRPNYST